MVPGPSPALIVRAYGWARDVLRARKAGPGLRVGVPAGEGTLIGPVTTKLTTNNQLVFAQPYFVNCATNVTTGEQDTFTDSESDEGGTVRDIGAKSNDSVLLKENDVLDLFALCRLGLKVACENSDVVVVIIVKDTRYYTSGVLVERSNISTTQSRGVGRRRRCSDLQRELAKSLVGEGGSAIYTELCRRESTGVERTAIHRDVESSSSSHGSILGIGKVTTNVELCIVEIHGKDLAIQAATGFLDVVIFDNSEDVVVIFGGENTHTGGSVKTGAEFVDWIEVKQAVQTTSGIGESELDSLSNNNVALEQLDTLKTTSFAVPFGNGETKPVHTDTVDKGEILIIVALGKWAFASASDVAAAVWVDICLGAATILLCIAKSELGSATKDDMPVRSFCDGLDGTIETGERVSFLVAVQSVDFTLDSIQRSDLGRVGVE
ncbi:hypothetical protein HG530_003191 [Fusarium avenaceum]|nr:hypothetical protein HG530_003191 [Fusarium avenaceum]